MMKGIEAGTAPHTHPRHGIRKARGHAVASALLAALLGTLTGCATWAPADSPGRTTEMAVNPPVNGASAPTRASDRPSAAAAASVDTQATALPVKSAGLPVISGVNQDLWQRLRLGMRIPPPSGDALLRAQAHERWYRTNRAHLQRTFTRARLYLHDIVEAVEREGMPMEIALLPAVESAFMAQAHSHANADGLWQFIKPTGRRFALQQHLFQDDRRSVRAATQAALRYLNELQQRYGGDYQLALAAYNTGEGNVDKAVRVARAKGLAGRYEDLRLHPETMEYVPKLLALSALVTQAVDSGDLADAGLPPMADAPYFVAVPIHRDLDVKLAAELAGLPLPDFRALNPQHRKPVIVAAATTEVLVPVDRQAAFEEALRHHRGPLATWTAATVPQRSAVEALARTHGISPSQLREVNDIPKGHLVLAGSTIVVPRVSSASDIGHGQALDATLATTPQMVRVTAHIARGETWAKLALRLALSETRLRQWNPRARLPRKGGSLSLVVPVDFAAAAAAEPPRAKPTGKAPSQAKAGKHEPSAMKGTSRATRQAAKTAPQPKPQRRHARATHQ